MNVINLPSVSLEYFGVNSKEKVISAMASDLGLGSHQLFHVLDERTAENGIAIKSHKTGRVVHFAESGTYRNEGDVTHWVLTPYQAPDLEGWTLIIYND